MPDSLSYSLSAACDPLVLHDRGRFPIGINQQQGGDDYPFVRPSEDIQQLLADACLSYKDDSCSLVRPFRIAWLYGFGCGEVTAPVSPIHLYDMKIVDATGAVVFNTLQASDFQTFTWGDRLRVMRWINEDEVLAVTAYTAWSEEDTPKTFSVYFEPERAILDERVSLQLPPQLRSLQIGDGGDIVRGSSMILRAGYNMLIDKGTTQRPSGGRVSTQLAFSATPGEGLGRYDVGCGEADDDLVVRRINSQSGDTHGNFLMDATGCYRVQRPVISGGEVRAASLQVANDCQPCRDCQDYINTYEAERRLSARVQALIPRLEALKANYLANVEKFLRSKACREADRLRLIVEPESSTVLAIALGFCNSTDECIDNLVLTASFQYAGSLDPSGVTGTTTFDGDATIVSGSTYRGGNSSPDSRRTGSSGRRRTQSSRYTLGGEWPHYWAHFDQVEPGAMGYVTWRMEFPDGASNDSVVAVADAYSLTEPPTVAIGSSFPTIGDYVAGEGPGAVAQGLRLVTTPARIAAGLVGDVDESFSFTG